MEVTLKTAPRDRRCGNGAQWTQNREPHASGAELITFLSGRSLKMGHSMTGACLRGEVGGGSYELML